MRLKAGHGGFESFLLAFCARCALMLFSTERQAAGLLRPPPFSKSQVSWHLYFLVFPITDLSSFLPESYIHHKCKGVYSYGVT